MSDEQKSNMPFITMEKRGALADLTDLYATVLTDAGSTLQSRGLSDMASLFAERLSGETDMESACRDLSGIIPSLDDRHFVSVQRTTPPVVRFEDSSTSHNHHQDEVMSELCFLKNARRLLCALSAKAAAAQSPTWTSFPGASFHTDTVSLAAPSVPGINALLHLGIIACHPLNTASSSSESVNTETLLKSIEAGGLGSEVALRAVAVVACHKVAEAIASRLGSANCGQEGVVVSPLQLSIYLDHVNIAGEEFTNTFIPEESGSKW